MVTAWQDDIRIASCLNKVQLIADRYGVCSTYRAAMELICEHRPEFVHARIALEAVDFIDGETQASTVDAKEALNKCIDLYSHEQTFLCAHKLISNEATKAELEADRLKLKFQLLQERQRNEQTNM